MEFYKLQNGRPVKFEKRYFIYNGRVYANPTDEQLKMAGYKTLVTSDKPEDGENYYYTDVYSETDTEIVQEWAKQEYELLENSI